MKIEWEISHLGAGFDTALWISSGEIPSRCRFCHRAMDI